MFHQNFCMNRLDIYGGMIEMVNQQRTEPRKKNPYWIPGRNITSATENISIFSPKKALKWPTLNVIFIAHKKGDLQI